MYSIRPPEYFPGLPFWALVTACDCVVLADDFQYSSQSFQNRSRLRNPDGWQWITIPLKGGQTDKPIADVEVDNTVPWRAKHLRALQYNYRSTPYFEAFEDRFIDFFNQDWSTLGAVTVASIRLVSRLLNLRVPETRAESQGIHLEGSELILDSDLALEGASVLTFEPPAYRQNFEGFEAGMSVLDAFFNLGPDTNSLITSASAIRD